MVKLTEPMMFLEGDQLWFVPAAQVDGALHVLCNTERHWHPVADMMHSGNRYAVRGWLTYDAAVLDGAMHA